MQRGEATEAGLDSGVKTPAGSPYFSSHQNAANAPKQQAISLTIALAFRQAPRRDAEVIKCVGNMWWNPKLPVDMRSAANRPIGSESALASLARDMAASQAGSRCASPLSSQLAAECNAYVLACWLMTCHCHPTCQCSLPMQLASRAHASAYLGGSMMHAVLSALTPGYNVALYTSIQQAWPAALVSLCIRTARSELFSVPSKSSRTAADTQGATARAGSASSSLRTLLSLHKVACMLAPTARLLRRLQNASAKLPLLAWTVHRPQVSSHKMLATHMAANVMCLLYDSLSYTSCTGWAPHRCRCNQA